MINFDGSIEISIQDKEYSKTTKIFDSYSQTMRISLNSKLNDKFGRSFLVYEKGLFCLYGLSDKEIKEQRVKGFGFFKSEINKSIDEESLQKMLLSKHKIATVVDNSNGLSCFKFNLIGFNNEDLIIEEKNNAWLVYFE